MSVFITTGLYCQNSPAAKKAIETFNGAVILNKIIIKQLICFSNDKKQDTLILTVNAGLISKSNSSIALKTFNKHILLEEGFSTKWFAERVFDDTSIHTPEQVKTNYDFDKHVIAISKATITTYTKNQISHFLNSIIRTRDDITNIEGADVTDKTLYKLMLNHAVLKSVFIPDFEQGGGSIYAYSAQEKQAVIFMQISD